MIEDTSFADEAKRFPRDRESQPEWLRQRLDEAKAARPRRRVFRKRP